MGAQSLVRRPPQYGSGAWDDVYVASDKGQIDVSTAQWEHWHFPACGSSKAMSAEAQTAAMNRPKSFSWNICAVSSDPTTESVRAWLRSSRFQRSIEFSRLANSQWGAQFGLTFPHWAAAVLLLPLWLLPAAVALRRRLRHRTGCCAKCAYNLTGNITGRYPECGAPFAPAVAEPRP